MKDPPRLLHATVPVTARPARISQRAARLLAACALGTALLAHAGAGDHESARDAVQSGQALALPVLLERLQRTYPGQVLELELERDDGRWVYQVKLLQPGGQVVKLAVDARTAEVLKQHPKGPPPTQGPAR
ncbi:PepSY domain-containing protein [Azohydromonas caseinilytica]|uniref:PepSY domain-containing protein n=1 Tax=Azohydromonas caseinilytica TaxID=2728836 RepID=A0A848FGT5_9BURK|nr:PepSY domain-containing protein [Azohydromonas caseinilytica]NML18554.1 PepSY domain-containing protein [Azohydromonas caseinilytica]